MSHKVTRARTTAPAADAVGELYAHWTPPQGAAFLSREVLPALLHGGGDATGNASAEPVRVAFSRRGAVYRCTVNGRAYAAKIVGPSAPPNHTTEAGYRWFQIAHERDPAQGTLAAPRPVAVFPELRTVVTGWIDAPTLKVVIQQGARERSLDALGAAARWLNAFHQMKADEGRFAPRHVLAAIDKLYRLEPTPTLREPGFIDAVERLRTLCSEFEGAPVPKMLLHNDVSIKNFAYDGRRAIGFDFYGERFGDPFKDYARLILGAELCLGARQREGSRWLIAEDIVERVLAEAGIAPSPEALMRLRLHLLAAALIRYGRQGADGPTPNRPGIDRLFGIASALATADLPDAAPGQRAAAPGPLSPLKRLWPPRTPARS